MRDPFTLFARRTTLAGATSEVWQCLMDDIAPYARGDRHTPRKIRKGDTGTIENIEHKGQMTDTPGISGTRIAPQGHEPDTAISVVNHSVDRFDQNSRNSLPTAFFTAVG